MTRRIARDSLPPKQREALLKRLTQRFAPWSTTTLSEGQALHQVSMAADPDARARGDRPELTAEDALDALAMAGPAMFFLELSELETMAYAHFVLGIEWEPIGLRLGYAPQAAKQGAQARYARLAGRYPWAVERIKQQAAPAATPADQEGGQQQ